MSYPEWVKVLPKPELPSLVAAGGRAGAFAFTAIGVMSVVASEQVVSWTGRYSWTCDHWWEYPASWITCFGVSALLGGTARLFWW